MFHIALQVHVQKLEYEIELLVRMHNVQQPRPAEHSVERARASDVPDDVVVLEFFQQTDLANGGARDAFVFCLEANLFERDDLVGGDVPRLVHDAVRSCACGGT